MALKLYSSAVFTHQNLQLSCNPSFKLRFKSNRAYQIAPKIFCSMEMAAGQPENSRKLSMGAIIDKARNLWNSAPEPVKNFPWDKTLENFIQLILDLAWVVIKYLSIPLFVVTSISEMSYCAHERKLNLVPIPFLIGVAVAGVLRASALEPSPYLKNAEIPWDLIGIMTFFVLLKFPGPYYPYWGRIFIPHFANGVILRTLWFTFQWYTRSQKTSENDLTDSPFNVPGPENS